MERKDVLSTIIIAAIVSLVLTPISGLIQKNLESALEKPDILIKDVISKNVPWAESFAELEIRVYNQGSKAAGGCFVIFNAGLNQWDSSNVFTVTGGQTESVYIKTDKYPNAGEYTFEAYVTCKNFSESAHEKRTIEVRSS
ncbi:MAG: CARDB domain-containing protein [Candidatus Nitrosotenuis sp.]